MSQSFFYHNKSLMRTSNLQVPTVENVDGKLSVKFSTKTYPEFLKDNTQTNLRSVDLGNGNYSYTVQRNIIFATPKVDKQKVVNVEVKPKIEAGEAIRSAQLTGQGKSIEIEVVGVSGKEFLLIIDRGGRIDLYSEKTTFGDYHQGSPAARSEIEKLYNKYVPGDARNLILKWQNAFTGSWAAEETEDGINYTKAENELISKLNLYQQKPEAIEKPIVESNPIISNEQSNGKLILNDKEKDILQYISKPITISNTPSFFNKYNMLTSEGKIIENSVQLLSKKIADFLYDKLNLTIEKVKVNNNLGSYDVIEQYQYNGKPVGDYEVLAYNYVIGKYDLELSKLQPDQKPEVREKPKLQQRRGNGKSIERKKPLSEEDLMPDFNEVVEESAEFKTKPKANTLQMDFITFAKMQEPEIKRSLIAMNRNKEIEVKCK